MAISDSLIVGERYTYIFNLVLFKKDATFSLKMRGCMTLQIRRNFLAPMGGLFYACKSPNAIDGLVCVSERVRV